MLDGTLPGHQFPPVAQLLEKLGVPYRIRTGVAAVREGQKALVRKLADLHGLLIY
jgi:hypothetical protein